MEIRRTHAQFWATSRVAMLSWHPMDTPRKSGVIVCAVLTSQPRFKSNIHGSPSIVRIRVRSWSSTASSFEKPPLGETTAHLNVLSAQAIGRLDFLQRLAPAPQRGLKLLIRSSNLEMSIFV